MYTSGTQLLGGITTPALVGIVCGSVAAVFVMAGIVVFLVKSNKAKEESSTKMEFNETTTTSSTKLIKDVDGGIGEMAQEDEDKWI